MLAAADTRDHVGHEQETHLREARFHRVEPVDMFEVGHDDLERRRVNLLREGFEAIGQEVRARDRSVVSLTMPTTTESTGAVGTLIRAYSTSVSALPGPSRQPTHSPATRTITAGTVNGSDRTNVPTRQRFLTTVRVIRPSSRRGMSGAPTR